MSKKEDKQKEYYKCVVGLIKKGKTKSRAAAICRAVVLKDDKKK